MCIMWQNSVKYGTTHPQLKRSTCVCDTRGVNHTPVGFLDSICVYTHMQYSHTFVFLHVYMLVWLI